MAANRAQKAVTLAEFRAWLEGVEELQAKDWCPDSKQWKLIRNKIKSITDVVADNTEAQPTPVYAARSGTPPAPSALGFAPAPAIDTGFPSDMEIVPPSPTAAALLTGEKRKTPDVDTSNGLYASSFT